MPIVYRVVSPDSGPLEAGWQSVRRLTGADFERLDRFLLNLDDADAMLLSTLDGFLSGIVVCPELIRPGEWLPQIWGGQGAGFADEREADEILGLIMTRYNEIVHDLGGEGLYEPVLYDDTDGSPLWEIWAEGFAQVLQMRPDAWEVYDATSDAEVSSPFHLLVMLAEAAIGGEKLPEDIADDVRADAVELIADCLEILNAARLTTQSRSPALRPGPKIGRNDPCPCGSGKKFKKCCMN
jgi:uncharacterized protein